MPSERYVFPHRHLLGIEPLSPRDITALLDQAQAFEEVCERPSIKIVPALRKKLVVNLFFENRPAPGTASRSPRSGSPPKSSTSTRTPAA